MPDFSGMFHLVALHKLSGMINVDPLIDKAQFGFIIRSLLYLQKTVRNAVIRDLIVVRNKVVKWNNNTIGYCYTRRHHK